MENSGASEITGRSYEPVVDHLPHAPEWLALPLGVSGTNKKFLDKLRTAVPVPPPTRRRKHGYSGKSGRRPLKEKPFSVRSTLQIFIAQAFNVNQSCLPGSEDWKQAWGAPKNWLNVGK